MKEKKLTILIAEDDKISRKMLSVILKNMGYNIVTAVDGEEAWKIISAGETHIDMAIVDWIMPKMEGPELCRKIKRLKRDVPIYTILLTSLNSIKNIIEGLNSGADDYIFKPYNSKVLNARILVGRRTIKLEQKMYRYSSQMEKLAKDRAKQLVHADRMATIGMLTAGVAHEINNPNSFISINIQTLERYWDKLYSCLNFVDPNCKGKIEYIVDEIPEMLKDMKDGVFRIEEIVKSLKSYSHVVADGKKYNSIKKSIDDSLKFVKNSIKGIEIIKEYDQNLDFYTIFDKRVIEQVFINLFINSSDAIKERDPYGDKFIKIKVDSDNDFINIKIEDNGPGIDEKHIDKIFNPFFTTKKVGKGTGLGLSICKNIIDEHNGRLYVENGNKKGAIFTISLPIISELDLIKGE